MNHSPLTVVHHGIQVGLHSDCLFSIVKAKANTLTVKDEESSILPFVLATKSCRCNDLKISWGLTFVYQFLCFKSEVLKNYSSIVTEVEVVGLKHCCLV